MIYKSKSSQLGFVEHPLARLSSFVRSETVVWDTGARVDVIRPVTDARMKTQASATTAISDAAPTPSPHSARHREGPTRAARGETTTSSGN